MKTNILNNYGFQLSYMHIHQVMDYSKRLEKPNDNNNHNHDIKNGFDFVIHGDVCINKP